jgi:hypothetical protein
MSTVVGAGTGILLHGFHEKIQQFGPDPGNVTLRVDAAKPFNTVDPPHCPAMFR